MLASGVRKEKVSASLSFLLAEQEQYLVRGEAAGVALDLMDGSRSIAEILEEGGARSPQAFLLQAIDRLHDAGLLAPGAPLRGGKSNVATRAFRQDLPDGTRDFCDVGAANWLLYELQGEGGPNLSDVQLVLADDYLQFEVYDLSEELRKLRVPWLLVKPSGRQLLLGPWFEPDGESAGSKQPCPACLRSRLLLNRPVDVFLQRIKGRASWAPRPPALPADPSTRAALMKSLMQALAERGDGLKDVVFEFSPDGPKSHRVIPLPQCPSCGDPSLQTKLQTMAPELQKRTISSDRIGGFRVRTAEQTFERYSPLIDPLLGAVTHVTLHDEREGAVVYNSGHRVTPWVDSVDLTFERQCGGKGRTRQQAQTSALCEALERISGSYRGDESHIVSRYAELERALHPEVLQHFSEAQRARAREQGWPGRAHQWVAQPSDPTCPMRWVRAWSLASGEPIWVPLAYCYSSTPPWPELSFCRHDPNGSAAGTCMEEAILQGLLERIERDAVAIWWANRLSRPPFESTERRTNSFVPHDGEEDGWKWWALDLTHDLGIPVAVVVAHHEARGSYCLGFGAHLDPALALERALTEMFQLRAHQGEQRTPWSDEELIDVSFLWPNLSAPRYPSELPSEDERMDLRESVRFVVRQLESCGLEAYVVDKTRPDLEISVVQVIVPALRHFWPRFGPGRLYDVPVQLGCFAHRLREDELNPASLFV